MSVKVNALDHLVINVSDVARSTEWYRKILGMEVMVFDPGPGKTPRTSLMFGKQKINVRPRNADKVEWFTADHETAGSDPLHPLLTASTPDQAVANPQGQRGCDRGGPGRQARRPPHAALGLLPGSRRQLDRDFVDEGGNSSPPIRHRQRAVPPASSS